MGIIMYGTRVSTKFEGYYGNSEECMECHKTYQKAYVKHTVWTHLNYIPLFPVKKEYFKMCPICGNGIVLKSSEAKEEIESGNDTSSQNLKLYAKHIIAKKPKGLLDVDTSYEVWVKDLSTGEDTCIATDLSKDVVKNIQKERGLKKIEIIDV